MRTRRLAALALLGLFLFAQGCVVPVSKYRKLQEEHDRLAKLLEEREGDLSRAQDSFRKRTEDLSRQLDLYQKQASASKTEADAAHKALEEARKKTESFENELKALGVGEVRDGRLVLQGSLLFGLGDDAVTPQGRHALDKIAAAFKSKDVLIQINGHTDNIPVKKAKTKAAHGDNMGLSAHRAIAVCRYLARRGIPERKMFIRAFGATWPVASNTTPAGQAKNRRVEILFIPSVMVPRPTPK